RIVLLRFAVDLQQVLGPGGRRGCDREHEGCGDDGRRADHWTAFGKERLRGRNEAMGTRVVHALVGDRQAQNSNRAGVSALASGAMTVSNRSIDTRAPGASERTS